MFKHFVIFSFSLLLIASCANAPQKTRQITQVNKPLKAIEPSKDSIEYYLAQAKLANQQEQTSSAIDYLLQLNTGLITQQQFTKALWLSNQLKPLIATPQNQYQLMLLTAESLHALNQPLLATKQLINANNVVSEHHLRHHLTYYQLSANIAQKNGMLSQALIANLHAFSLNTQADVEHIEQLWQQFTQLSQWQLSLVEKAQPPYSKGWLALIRYANKYGDKHAQFQRYMLNWQRQYPQHPANAIVNKLLNQLTQSEPQTVKNIAVLLPLSGKQQSAGIAAQQGILAAYNNNKAISLYFIDTNTLDWSTLNDTLSAQQCDHIIGPLLKPNVSLLLAQNIALPTLLLNIQDNMVLTEQQAAISMRPDHEAIQAATTLSQQGYKKPLLISDSDVVSKRIAEQFIQQWQKSSQVPLEVFYVDKNQKQQKSIQTSLDFWASKVRIAKLKSRLRNSIKTEPRNRRDIDMIYLIANSQQTRLYKPYIDVSISPFADLIPVFANSRSHSAKNEHDSARDLSGLTFTEIPWLLPSKQQNTPLFKVTQQLWADRSDSLQTIFALGYDSFALINKLSLMLNTPYIQHFGQTGVLKLNNNHILTRSLLWGKYRNNKVQAIAF